MKNRLNLLSPAKINLRLDVLGKREDGYHEIESIMTRVSVFDEVSILTEGGEGLDVICDGYAPSGRDNIAYKAAKAILDKHNGAVAVRIDIRKNIPVAAGLGGGSSNAATVLKGLNEMLNIGLHREELMQIGRGLGADVPFFIFERPAIARGIGEIFEAVDLPNLWLMLINPNIPVPTADVYKGLNLKIGLTKKRIDIKIPHFNSTLKEVVGILHNDLEDVAFKMHPEIGYVKDELLLAGATGALMSGSGATVFGLFESREKALDAFVSLSSRHDGWRLFLAESI